MKAVGYPRFLFMKYNILINQAAAVKLNLKLDYLDLAIFDCVAGVLNRPEFPSLSIPSKGMIFKWVSTRIILQDLPLLGLKERAIRSRIDKLVDAGLLIKHVDINDGNKPYYTQGKNFSKMFVANNTTRQDDADPRQENADTTRQDDADPRNTDADNYNNNNNTKDNNITNYNNGNENKFSPAPPRTEQRKFSKDNGLTPWNLNVRQSAIDKIDAAFEQLIFPYEDAEFKRLFYILCCSPKWRAKTIHAFQMSLNKLQNYDRDFSAKLIEDSIAGGWQGLVFGDTDKKYQDYLKTKKGGISIGSGVTYNPMSEQERQEYMDFLKMMDE